MRLSIALALVLLRHASQIVRGLEAAQENLQVLDGFLAGNLESIDRAHVRLGVNLNADDDTVVKRMRALQVLLAATLKYEQQCSYLVGGEGDLWHGQEGVANQVAHGVVLGTKSEDLSVGGACILSAQVVGR